MKVAVKSGPSPRDGRDPAPTIRAGSERAAQRITRSYRKTFLRVYGHGWLTPLEFRRLAAVPTNEDRACPSCGVVGPPHGCDSECIAALRHKVDQLNTFVHSLVKQSDRRRSSLPAPVAERVEGSLSHRDPCGSVPSNPRLRIVRSNVAIQL